MSGLGHVLGGTGIVDKALEPVEVPVGYDAGIIVVGEQRGIHRGGRFPHGSDRALLRVLGNVEVVGGEADLPGVHHLAHRDPLARLLQVDILAEEHRRLAAEFERDGHEVLRRGLHHLAPGRGGPGEDEVIERQLAECMGDFRPAGHHRAFVFRETRSDEFGHQFARAFGELARLDHRAVSRREHLHQRAEAEVDGEIPRTEDADHALGLEPQLCLAAEQAERELRLALLRLRPALQVLEAVFPEPDRPGDVGDHRLLDAAVSEIRAHRPAEFVGIVPEQGHRPLDPVTPGVKRFGPRDGESGALALEQRFEFGTGHRCSPVRFALPRVSAIKPSLASMGRKPHGAPIWSVLQGMRCGISERWMRRVTGMRR